MFDDPINLPTYVGDKNRTLTRVMADAVGGFGGIRKVYRTDSSGVVTRLETRNGFPRVFSEKKDATGIAGIVRSLAVSARSLAHALYGRAVVWASLGAGFVLDPSDTLTIETPTGYSVSPLAPEGFPEEADPSSDYFDVFNLVGTTLLCNRGKLRDVPGEMGGIPVLIPNGSGKYTASVDDLSDYHVFTIDGYELKHVAGRKPDVDAALNANEAIDDALPITVSRWLNGVRYVRKPSGKEITAYFYGSSATHFGANNEYLNGYNYLRSVLLSASPPYIESLGMWYSTYTVDADMNPTAGVSSGSWVSGGTPSVPFSVPSTFPSIMWVSLTQRHLGPYVGDELAYRGTRHWVWYDLKYMGKLVLDVQLTNSLENITINPSGSRSKSEVIAKFPLGDTVVDVTRSIATSFNYFAHQIHSGEWRAVYNYEMPPHINYELLGMSDRRDQPWIGNWPTSVAVGGGMKVESTSSLDFKIDAGGVQIVRIVGTCLDNWENFTGDVLVSSSPDADAAWIQAYYYDNAATVDETMANMNANGPTYPTWGVDLLPLVTPLTVANGIWWGGVKGLGNPGITAKSVNDTQETTAHDLTVYAADYVYHDVKNDVAILFEFKGSGTKDKSSGEFRAVLIAKGRVQIISLGSFAGEGITLGIYEREFVTNLGHPNRSFSTPVQIPGFFSPESDQSRVDYLCYTTFDEELAGVPTQFIIDLPVWLEPMFIPLSWSVPDSPPHAKYVKLHNTYQAAQCLDGGVMCIRESIFKVIHLRFSNQGDASMADVLNKDIPSETETVVKCWRV